MSLDLRPGLKLLLQSIDADAARAFVTASRNVIDALMIEAGRVAEARGPQRVDYERADLPRDAPPGGWISADELRETTRRMTEAIAAEKWVDGAVFAIRALSALGVLA